VAAVFAASKMGLNSGRMLSLALGKGVKLDWKLESIYQRGVAVEMGALQ